MDETQAQELIEHLSTVPLAERADALDRVIDALETELESTADPDAAG